MIEKTAAGPINDYVNVGLDYITLSRSAGSLSGGEAQRIRLATQIGLIYRQWRKVLDVRLQAYGLSDASWTLLVVLARAGCCLRQKELAAQLWLDTSSLVRPLRLLREQGLIDWTRDKEDQRAKAIVLTLAGKRLVQTIEGVSSGIESEVLEGIGDEDLAITRQVLHQIMGQVIRLGHVAA